LTTSATAPAAASPTPLPPGVYDQLPADEYHRQPALSSSGARKLLAPSCPALFRHEQLHGRKPKRVFDLGHAAHALVLGNGPELVEVDAADWRTNKAKQAAAEARERGAVPLLPQEYAEIRAMAAALREHPTASALFDPARGRAEVSLFWRDEESGVDRRARLDWLPDPVPGERMIVPDYKSTVCAEPGELRRHAYTFGYNQQAPWYLDAVCAFDMHGRYDPAFVFVFQEKTAPYLVTVVEPDVIAMEVGRQLNRRAIEVYARCMRRGVWPGYSDDIEPLPLPGWVERAYEMGDL
jgi:hypothetical protein